MTNELNDLKCGQKAINQKLLWLREHFESGCVSKALWIVHKPGRLYIEGKVVTGPPWPRKQLLLYVNFKNVMIFLPLKKFVTTISFVRPT